MTKFRPCIDLHNGRVKQIVGSTLTDKADELEVNYESDRPARYFAEQYKKDALLGGHVIKLGPNNDAAAREVLRAYPGGLQVGGGIHLENSAKWLEAGASHVIITSSLFDEAGHFMFNNLQALVRRIGRERIVLDLSCRATEDGWVVAMNRWQTRTDLKVDTATIEALSGHCAEFLVHAADVEGKCEGIDPALVTFLGANCSIPVTYAGGANSLDDLSLVDRLSNGRVDLTIGSALDMFGGSKIRYRDCVEWNRRGGEAGL
jgi:phosphoribosylformimino-5-aminoimidazole carboxamide ribotide isomerase